MYSRIYAEINLDAVAENFAAMKKNIDPKTKIMAVVKADGYGHGAVPIARLAEEYEYIWGLATATAEEALQLRTAGIKKPILVLGFVFEEHYAQIIEHDIRIVVFKRDMAEQLSAESSDPFRSGYRNDTHWLCGYGRECFRDQRNLQPAECGGGGHVYTFCQSGRNGSYRDATAACPV